MSEAHAPGAADGRPPTDPGPCIPARAARALAAHADDADAGGQQLRRQLLAARARIRDAPGGTRPARATRQLTLAVDGEVYRAFQARCREHDLTVAMALELLMGGRELPAPRPQLLQLPAVVDAEALHVLHHLEQRIAACPAGGALERAEAGRIHALLAGLSETIGGSPCSCAARARAHRQGDERRADA